MRITDFSPYAHCNYPENHSKKNSPAAGLKYRNQLCLLVNTPKNFSLRRASLLGVCLHNVVYLCIHTCTRGMYCICLPQARKFWYTDLYKRECIEFARRRRENFGYTDLYTNGNA